MEIIFRPLKHGHGNQVGENYTRRHFPSVADAVSVTANLLWLTPMTTLAGEFGWNQEMIRKAATRANRFHRVAALTSLKPRLLIVPKTFGQSAEHLLTKDLLDCTEELKSEVLSMTHYGFIRSTCPAKEMASVFEELAARRSTTCLQVVIWDIDQKYLEEAKLLWKSIAC